MSTVRIKKGRSEIDYTNVVTIQKTYYDNGVDITLRADDGRVIKKIEMPRQGKVVYIMDAQGNTTDAIFWPPDSSASAKVKKQLAEETEAKARSDAAAEVNIPVLRV